MRFAGEELGPGILIRSLLGSETITPAEARQGLLVPDQTFLLDPVQAAAAAGGSEYERVAQKVNEFFRVKENRHVDRGAFELDRLLRSVGLPSNISGVGNPPSEYYPIEPGVTYKRQFMRPRSAGKADSSRPGRVVEFIGFDDTPMMDWDTPSDYHRAQNVTVRHLGDVEELARQYVQENPESVLKLYQTPGGFRAWELGQRVDPISFQPNFEALKVDGDYAVLAASRPSIEVDGIPVAGPAYSARISAKPGRTDWVAQPIATLRGSAAMADPTSLRRVEAYHDGPINRAYLRNGVNDDALNVLRDQAPTASIALQQELRRRFGV